jgi:hypothetical protein
VPGCESHDSRNTRIAEGRSTTATGGSTGRSIFAHRGLFGIAGSSVEVPSIACLLLLSAPRRERGAFANYSSEGWMMQLS